MKTPKRMFPNGLKTVATGIAKGDNEVTRKERETLTKGVQTGGYLWWTEEKSYWDHDTKTVKTVRVKKERTSPIRGSTNRKSKAY